MNTPAKQAASSGWVFLASLIGIVGLLAVAVAFSQYVAASFGHAAALGRPVYRGMYQPSLGFITVMNLDMRCYGVAQLRHVTLCSPGTLAFLGRAHVYLAELFGGVTIAAGIPALIGMLGGSAKTSARGRRLPQVTATGTPPLTFTLGTATGKLAKLGHGAAIAAGQIVRLVGDEAAQNIVCFGGIGSGKTTRLINPIIAQAVHQDCGMLVLDVKGDYGATLRELAGRANRKVVTIGIGAKPFNLIEGLKPEVAGSFLKSALLLGGNTSAESTFWNEIATQLATSALGVLEYFPAQYTLTGLFEYIFYPATADDLQDRVDDVFGRLTLAAEDKTDQARAQAAADEQKRLLRYVNFKELVFDAYDEKIRNGARTQLSQVLTQFMQPEIERAFCTAGEENARIEDVLDGTVFLLDLPIQDYGLGAKTVYTVLKLRFFSVIEQRRTRPDWNQDRSVVFACDEYQEIISVAKGALSDLNFWDKSRSSKCVGVISAQGVESFRAAIGNQSLTDALLQNFRQTICFATEDRATIERMSYLFGQVEIARENTSRSRSKSSSTGNSTSGRTDSTSVNRQMQAVVNPQMFRQLAGGEALAILRLNGEAYDDILRMTPVYTGAPTAVASTAKPASTNEKEPNDAAVAAS